MEDTVTLARYIQHLREYAVYYVRKGVPDGQMLDLVAARAEACGFLRTLITPAVLSALKSEPSVHAAAHLMQLARASRQQAATAAAAATTGAARPAAVPAHMAAMAAQLTSQQLTTLRMAQLAAQGYPNAAAAAPVPKKQRTTAGSAAAVAAAAAAGGSAQVVEVEQEDDEGQAVVRRQARRALHAAGNKCNRHDSLQLPN